MSSDEISIRVNKLNKCYEIYEQPHDRLKQFIFPRAQQYFGIIPKQYFREFWALKDVSFEIKRGETVGIIGRNGSGKSTLLQLICGTLSPTSGSVETNGRIAALLELGSGFSLDFTGRENVYMNAAVLGLSKQEIDERFDAIAAFADIGQFIEEPVKSYSSGMVVRLAFAVIAHVDADILVVDEALSVGDAYFVQKCMRFLRGFMENGTLLFCSHDTSAVANLCNKALLLEQASVAVAGAPKDVIEHYLEALHESDQGGNWIVNEEEYISSNPLIQDKDYKEHEEEENTPFLREGLDMFKYSPEQSGFGTGIARIISVTLHDNDGASLPWVNGGEEVTLEVRCKAKEELTRPIVGFQFKDRLGQVIFADNTFLTYQFNTPFVEAGAELIARFNFRLPILPSGDYAVTAAIAEGSQDTHVQHHWMHDALIIRVNEKSICFGLIGVPMKKIDMDIE